jgi:hypothetical protein
LATHKINGRITDVYKSFYVFAKFGVVGIFLASDGAAAITGEGIGAAGGMS